MRTRDSVALVTQVWCMWLLVCYHNNSKQARSVLVVCYVLQFTKNDDAKAEQIRP